MECTVSGVRAAARLSRCGLGFVLVAWLSIDSAACASSTPQNGFSFGKHELAGQPGQGVVGDTTVSHLVRQVLVRGDRQPDGYQFYVYPYFEATQDERIVRTRIATARALLGLFKGVGPYTEKHFDRAQSALFVLPIADEAGLEQLRNEPRIDVTQAAEVMEAVYDYEWARDQIRLALRDRDPAETPLRPVSLVISRRPLDGSGQASEIYVVPIEHSDVAAPVVDRVRRALEDKDAVLPSSEDFLTRFADWVGARLLVTYDTLNPR